MDKEKLYSLLKVAFKNEEPTHSEVLIKAKELASIIIKKDCNDNLINECVARFEENHCIKGFDIESIDDSETIDDWFIKEKESKAHKGLYFERYIDYLRTQDFPEDVLTKMEKNCEYILTRCANPNASIDLLTLNKNKKKGLVMGDVQSGKTSNYLALVNMAADYGYKIIVVLAGLTDSLRRQTQERLDAGFIGAQSSTISKSEIIYLGVGKDLKTHFAVPITNDESDFNKAAHDSINSTRDDYNKPIVLVIKKNKSTLENVISWLKPESQNVSYNNILIIDDEADNASINTKKPEDDPSCINRCIRKLYNKFPIATYVGYTATPFANIFIDSYDEENNADLFPSDFIALLKDNDNTGYFGAKKFFGEDGRTKHIREINTSEEYFLKSNHRKDSYYFEMSNSLKEAVLVFLINSAIRSIRGKEKAHRSMIINISRFIAMHNKIRNVVNEYVENIKNIILQRDYMSEENFLKDSEMKKIYDIYMTDPFYDEIRKNIDWKTIQKALSREITSMEVVKLNAKKSDDEFSYKTRENGARVIIVGGFVLSRGLTLEGLLVSYYHRNGSAYDTLLQMCRWFGYRKGYEDLCRLYISRDNTYSFLAAIFATNDLVDQFDTMIKSKKTPKEFGFKVLSSPDILETTIPKLLVTSKNKMRTAQNGEIVLNYSGEVVDTSKFSVDKKVNDYNIGELNTFIKETGQQFKLYQNRYMIKDVDKTIIADFVQRFNVCEINRKFDHSAIAKYIKDSPHFSKWDVVVATGLDKSEKRLLPGMTVTIPIPQRSFSTNDDKTIIRVSDSNNRLIDPGIFNSGLTEEEIKSIGKKTPSAFEYLSIKGRKPLLVIYPILLKSDIDNDIVECFKENDGYLLGIAIGFPLKGNKVKIKCKINQRKYFEMHTMDEDEEVSND